MLCLLVISAAMFVGCKTEEIICVVKFYMPYLLSYVSQWHANN